MLKKTWIVCGRRWDRYDYAYAYAVDFSIRTSSRIALMQDEGDLPAFVLLYIDNSKNSS